MATDYDSLVQQDVASRGVANTAGVHGVSPEDGATGLDTQALTGIPPAVGMRSPQDAQAQAQTAQQNATIASNPGVATWAATAQPAHLAVTQDDFPSLAKIHQTLNSALNSVPLLGQAVTDIKNVTDIANRSVLQSFDDYISNVTSRAATGNIFPSLKETSSGLNAALSVLSYIPSAVLAPGTERAAAALAPHLTQSQPLLPWEKPHPLLTPVDQLNEARNIINTGVAAFFLGEGGVKAVKPFVGKGQAPSGGPTPGLGGPFPAPSGPTFDPADLATHDESMVQRVQDAVAASKTQARSPEVTEAFVRQQVPVHTVAVDPDKLIALAQEDHEPFPELGQQVVDAARNGEPVEVPFARYIAQTSGQPYAEDLNHSTVFREGGTSVQEASDAAAVGPKAEVPPGELAPPAQTPEDFTPEEAQHARFIAAASDTAIDQVVQDQRIRELFADPKALEMTKDQFYRYNLGIENAIADARDRLHQRAFEAVRAERKAPFQEALVQHTAAAEQDLAQVPAIRARAYLAQGKGPLGEPLEGPLKLDRDADLSQYGKDLGLPDSMFRRGGLSPDEAADLLGYPSGADLLRDLSALHEAQGDLTIPQHMKTLVRVEALRRTRTELGYDVSPEALHAAASELVNAPEITDFLADHLKSFADEHNLPFDKDLLKAEALAHFDTRQVAEAINLKRMEKFLQKDGKKVEQALLKSDIPAAFRWKQIQLRHQIELTQAHKFLKEYNKAEKLFKRVASKVSIPSVSQDALNWSKDILATTGRKVKGNPTDLQALHSNGRELRDYIQEKNAEGADITQSPVPRQDLAKSTVASYRAISNMVTSIMKWGRLENEVEMNGQREALHDATQQGIDSLSRYTRTISDEELAHPDLLQKADAVRRAADAWLVRLEQLMRDFGARDPNSPFFQAVSRPLQERKGWSNAQRMEMAKHFREVGKAVGKGFDKWLDTRLGTDPLADQVRTADGSRLFVKNRDIYMAALHLGDEGALRAFADGYGVEPALIESIVHAHATPAMWKATEGIWQAFEKLRPEIIAQYKARSGVTPTMVDKRPFAMPDGSINPGGYFPIRHDMAQMPKEWVRQQEALAHMLGSPRYERAAPSNGYIKERTGAVGPMDMDPRSIYGRINQTIHDLAYRDILAQMNRFLLHPDMVQAITHKYGPEYVAKIRQDIRDIAGSETMGAAEAKVAKGLDYLTEAQMVNMIGFSPKTMIKHGLTAQAQAVSEVGFPRYAASMRRFALHPTELTNQAMESSDIRHILTTYNEDAFRQFMELTSKRGNVSRYMRSFAFHMVGTSNWLTAVPLYDAAKGMIGDKFPELDEAGVQAAAGQLVRQALGSTGPTDSPIALRMGGGLPGRFFRLTNPFLSFLSHMYNKQREILQAFGFAGEKADYGRGLAILMASVIVPIYIEQAVTRGELSLPKKAQDLFEYWAAGLVHNEFGGVPIANSAVAVAARKLDKEYPQGDDTVTSLFGSLGQTAADINDTFVKHHPWTEKKTERATIAGGYAFRAPGVALSRVEHFIYELRHTPSTALHDLFFGAHSKGR